MTFRILTLFPELFQGYLGGSILAKAIERRQVSVQLVDIRDYARDKHRSCDDTTYGGGAGMILKPEPVAEALDAVKGTASRIVYLTPSGGLFHQAMAAELAAAGELVIICGRYEGLDQRIIDQYVTDEISLGDYVLSGGEVAAMVLVDTIVRLVPEVIKGRSLEEESFQQGLLEYPQYTRPEVFRGQRVPEVLLGGHHEQIRRWRLRKSLEKTLRYRPEILRGRPLPEEAAELLREIETEGETHEGPDQRD